MVALNQRQSPSGQVGWVIEADAAVDYGNQAAAVTTENAQAVTGLALGDTFLAASRGLLEVGLFFSHTRVASADNGLVALANSTAAPIDAAVGTYDRGPLLGTFHRASPSGLFAVGLAGSVSIDIGAINADANGVGAAALLGTVAGDFAVVSPRTALTAGLALSNGFVPNADLVSVVLHNLTAGGAIDPPALDFDVVVLKRLDPLGFRPRVSPSGAITIQRIPVTINPASIAVETVVETTVAISPKGLPYPIPSTANNRLPVILANPVAALPAGLAVSHARVTAANTVAIGLANVSAAPIDAGDIAFNLTCFMMPEK